MGKGVVAGAGDELAAEDGTSEDLAFWRGGCHHAQGTESPGASWPRGHKAGSVGGCMLQGWGGPSGAPGLLWLTFAATLMIFEFGLLQEAQKGQDSGLETTHQLSCPWHSLSQLPLLCLSSASHPPALSPLDVPKQPCLGIRLVAWKLLQPASLSGPTPGTHQEELF